MALRIYPKEEFPIDSWVNPKTAWIPQPTLGFSVPGELVQLQYRAIRCQNTVKVPHCSATLSDELFRVYRSRTVTSHALRSIQLLSRLVS